MDTGKKIHRLFGDGVSFIAGGAAFGMAVSMFTAPNQIAPGGVTGVAVIIGYLTGAPAGTTAFLLNIPLLLLAYRRVGRDFFWRTVGGLLISSVLIDVMALWLPPFSGDRLLAAVFGGVLTGVGLGCIYRRGGSTGGAEIVATLLRKRFAYLSVGSLLLAVDAAVILLSAAVYRSLDSALYAAVSVFLAAQVMDRLVYGSQTAKVALIVSAHWQAVSDAILSRLSRGVTQLDATGAYSGETGRLLLCAVGRTELFRLRQLVLSLDPAAFIVFTTAEEICGSGFQESAPPTEQ